ncbi:hypothetical protein [Oribacterium sp. WCC10]|uniref:hypothetical protein n=1 Tax=Oribacterium sp. WCC10 TaxID=1855343 RepID=UPI0008E50C9B|nr:hypothetical protein [Oribacterium sp. WCC10]SFG36714.1 hypothetical protein SAMN05216356_106182 [Oribacterium sp. WCC10]
MKDIIKIIKGIDIKEAFAYAVLIVFFFWWQKFFPNLSFAYIEKVTLVVRSLYAVVLADTVISSVKKALVLLNRRRAEEVARKSKYTDGKKSEGVEARAEEITGETTVDSINYVSASQISKSESVDLVDENSMLSRISDFLFYGAFALCFGLALLSSTRFPGIIHLFAGMHRLGVNLSCLMVLFLFNRKPAIDLKILILQIFILIADIGFMAVHGGIWLYPMMIFVVGAYGREFLPVVHIALVESALIILATGYCSFTGIIEMVIKDGKHAYGYAGPNEASMQYLFFLMMYFFARYYAEKKKVFEHEERGEGEAINFGWGVVFDRLLNVIDAVVLSVGVMFIVFYSSGRASIVCVLALAAGVMIYKLSKLYPVNNWNDMARKVIDKIFFLAFVPIYIYVAVFSFVSSYFFDPDKPYGWILLIGKVFDPDNLIERLRLGKQGILGYMPSIFGTNVRESLEENYFIIDNFYIKSFLQYGIIYFVCTLLIFTILNYALWKRKDYFVLFLLSIVAGLSFLEATIGEIQYDIFPLIVFTCDVGCLAIRRDGAYN